MKNISEIENISESNWLEEGTKLLKALYDALPLKSKAAETVLSGLISIGEWGEDDGYNLFPCRKEDDYSVEVSASCGYGSKAVASVEHRSYDAVVVELKFLTVGNHGYRLYAYVYTTGMNSMDIQYDRTESVVAWGGTCDREQTVTEAVKGLGFEKYDVTEWRLAI